MIDDMLCMILLFHVIFTVISRFLHFMLYSAVAGLKLLGGPTTSAKVTKFQGVRGNAFRESGGMLNGVLIKLTQSQNNYSNLHFYCSTLVFNIYFLEFAKLLGGPGPPRPLPTLRHCYIFHELHCIFLQVYNKFIFSIHCFIFLSQHFSFYILQLTLL